MRKKNTALLTAFWEKGGSNVFCLKMTWAQGFKGITCYCWHLWECTEEGRGTNGKGEKEILPLVSPRAGWDFYFPQSFVALSLCLWLLFTLVSLAECLLYHTGKQSKHFSTTSDIKWGRGSRKLPVVMVQMEGAIPNTENHNYTMTQWSHQNDVIFNWSGWREEVFAFCVFLLGFSFRQKAWSLKLGEFLQYPSAWIKNVCTLNIK